MSLRCLISAAALLLTLTGTPPVLADSTSLRGLETRNDALAWQAVGRLDAAVGSYCTGTLIAPEFVLTAAHCVYDRRTKALLKAGDFTFRAGLTKGAAAADRRIAQIEVHPGYDPTRPYDLQNVRHDLALLRLETPIPSHELDPFVVFAGALPEGPVSVVSYGQGRSNRLSRQDECQVLGRVEGAFALDCDVTFGSSGAPVFTHLNGRGQIASVISGGGTFAGQKVAFGMSLPALVAELKQQMRAHKPLPKARIRRLEVGDGRRSTGAKFVPAKGS